MTLDPSPELATLLLGLKEECEAQHARAETLKDIIRRLLAANAAGIDGSPNNPDNSYCWWCMADVNGKQGDKQPHEPDCIGMKAWAAVSPTGTKDV